MMSIISAALFSFGFFYVKDNFFGANNKRNQKKRELDFTNFSQFELIRVLSLGENSHFVSVLVRPKDDRNHELILQIEKVVWCKSTVEELFSNTKKSGKLELLSKNDIYKNYTANIFSNCKVLIVSPVNEHDTQKYLPSQSYSIIETPDHYKKYVKEYIHNQPEKRIQWLLNLIAGVAEQEKILLRSNSNFETGFILFPDFKWDGKLLEKLYFHIVPIRKDIKSIRDLNAKHLDLLENMVSKTKEKLCETFNMSENHLIFFVHYHPSYYHFHIHVVHCSSQIPGLMSICKAIPISDVIQNLKMDSEYYTKAHFSLMLPDHCELYKMLKNK